MHIHMPAAIHNADLTWFSAIHAVHSPVLDWMSAIVSTLTWAGWCWWVLAVILWVRGYRLFATQLAIALVIGSIEAEGFKHLMHRIRPSLLFPQEVRAVLPDILPSKYSFPSGHTTLAAAAAFIILLRTGDWRGWLAVLVTVVVAFSRVYEGFHWPSDVIAGMVFGVVAGILAVLVCRPLQNSRTFNVKDPEISRMSRVSAKV